MNLPGAIVDPEWLRARLGAPGLVIADVRWVPGGAARDPFERAHLPGAVSLDLDVDLSAPRARGPGRHPLPPPKAFAATMSAAGIAERDAVVAYDDAGGSIAARLWWMLRVTGHAAAVLDGGLAAWRGSLETGPAEPRVPASFTERAWPAAEVVDVDEVARALSAGTVVLDARAAERYRGEIEPIDPVAGHIPGARSAPWTENLDPSTGRFLPPDELRERFGALLAMNDVIAYCGSGTTACHDVLAFEIAGLVRPRLYEGSWSDWCSDPARPVAIGPETGPQPGTLA